MDNLNDEFKNSGNPAGDNHQHEPDPMFRAKDGNGDSNETRRPHEHAMVTKKPMPLTDATLMSNQFMGAGEPMHTVQSGINIIESILRYKLMIAAVFLLVSIPSIVIIWTQIVPNYRARGEVRVRPIIPSLVFRTEDNGMIPLYNSFLNTQVSIIRSLTVLQRVLDRQEIQETDWYKGPRKSVIPGLSGDKTPPMERLRDNLSVRPRNRTEIIDVTFSCRNPKDAKLIVDTVLDQYIKYVREMSNATEDQLYRQLVEQYKSLESEIQGREKIVAELRRSLGAEIPQDLISAKRSHLDETQVRLDELQQSLAVLEWEREKQNLVANKKIHLDQTQFRLGKIQQNIAMLDWEREKLMEYIEQAESSDGNNTSVAFLDDTNSQSKYFVDTEWRKLDVEVKTLRHQIENSLYTSKHPNMIQARKDLEFKEELLRQRELQLDQQMSMDGEGGLYAAGMEGLSYEEKLKSLDYQRERVKHEEELLVAEFGKEQAEFDTFFKNVQLLQEESDELQHKRDLFSAIRQRLDQKNVERNVPGSIDVLMWAFVPSKPHNDRRIVYTAMVLIFGLGLGCGIALLRASKHQAVYNVKDMSLPMQVPFLGHIPLIRLRKPFGGTLREEIEHNQFLLIESIRVMRTTLLSRLDEQGSATVLITSSTAGTGKSSFTKILGKCMAKAGKKVLMIDVDFHKMTLSKWFELVDKPGFIDGLHTRSVDNRHIYQTDIPGLSVMPSGVRDDNNRIVYEEIANGAFETYISELRKENTIILLDSSPILPIADAVIMSSQVDGTIMVERELVSRRGSVENAISRLGSAGGHLLGVVFVGSSGYEKYGYGYDSSYYGYGYTYSATS